MLKDREEDIICNQSPHKLYSVSQVGNIQEITSDQLSSKVSVINLLCLLLVLVDLIVCDSPNMIRGLRRMASQVC